jgi:hypothetical protein
LPTTAEPSTPVQVHAAITPMDVSPAPDAATAVLPPIRSARAKLAPGARPECTDAIAAELATQLRVRWGSAAVTVYVPEQPADPRDPLDMRVHGPHEGVARLDGADTAWIELRCTGGLFPAPGFFVEAWDNRFTPDRSLVRHRLIISYDDGRDLASAPDVDEGLRLDDHRWQFRTADLDGDGTDELVVSHNFDHHGHSASTASVIVVDDRKLVQPTDDPIVFALGEPDEPERCTGKLTSQPAGKLTQVVTQITKTKGAPCPDRGRHVYGLRDGALVEVTP